MRSAASRAATTMTTHSTAERTLLRFCGSVSCSVRAGGRSVAGAVGGGEGSIGGPRVPPRGRERSATARAVVLEQTAGGSLPGSRQRGIGRLCEVAIGSEPKEQALQPSPLAHGKRDPQTAAAQLLARPDRVLLGHPTGGRLQLDRDPGIVVSS